MVSIDQSIKTDLYSAMCHKRIRDMYWATPLTDLI